MPLQQAEAAVFLHHLLCIDCSCLKASCDATSSINQVDYVCSAESTLHLQDTTFEMERQRNKPVKYNRELVHKSVKAMQKVEEVCSSTILNSKSSLQQGHLSCMHETNLQDCYTDCTGSRFPILCFMSKQPDRLFCISDVQVRVARQDRFHEARMKRAAKQQNRADQKELETGIDLIEAPVARLHREQKAQAEAQPMAVEQEAPVKEKVQAKQKPAKQKLRIPVEKPKKRVTAMES